MKGGKVETLFAAIRRTGLVPRGALRLEESERAGELADISTIVLAGIAGRDGWGAFAASPEARDGADDPLDRWSRRVIETLARELGHYGIQSNAIGPGLIRTRLTEPFLKNAKFMRKYKNLIPAGRLGMPEDIAGPAAFLASSDADYVNGVLLFVDGGQLA